MRQDIPRNTNSLVGNDSCSSRVATEVARDAKILVPQEGKTETKALIWQITFTGKLVYMLGKVILRFLQFCKLGFDLLFQDRVVFIVYNEYSVFLS